MDSVPIIVSTVLLAILLPAVAYVYITTPTKEDFRDHLHNDEENFREIRGGLSTLSDKIDRKFDSMSSLIRSEK